MEKGASIMSSIGNLGGLSSFVSNAFSKIDTKNQGYISKSDLQSAFDKVAKSNGDSSSSVDELFSKLDTNGDSKVTKDEFTSGLQKLASQLDSQFNSMRMGQMPPPPGGIDQSGGDQGKTKDQLKADAKAMGSGGISSMLNSVADNFDKVDTNHDGKVDAKEIMAYAQQQQSSTSSTSNTSGNSKSSSKTTTEQDLLAQIMQLMKAYGAGDNTASAFNSLFSAKA
jgi:Ca2+-binding EF-hand superfamily protein